MDQESLNRFRSSLKTAYDLSDWFNEISDDDTATEKQIKADIRNELSRIIQYGEEVIHSAE